MIEDLLMNIPNKVGKPAIEIIGAKKDAVTKWLYYEANSVSRRNPLDFGNLERRNGILIMIQAFITALSNPSFKEAPVPSVTRKVESQDWMTPINNFKNRKTVDKVVE